MKLHLPWAGVLLIIPRHSPLMFFDLFDTTGFPARWHCGSWSDLHGWTHVLSDVAIFGAYAAIPISIAQYVLRKRQEMIFKKLYWLFALFILSCGFTHLIEATIFWHPWYRLSALVKVVTAVASWATVWVLWRDLPVALSLPGIAKINRQLLKEVEERKAVEVERERLLTSEKAAREEAEKANRMKDQFLATLSHELRTPLNAIVGWAHLLRTNKDNSDLVEGLEIIERNSHLQAKLIEDLLDLSRIATGKMEFQKQPVDLCEVVRSAVGTVQNTGQDKGLSMVFEIPLTPCVIEGDSARLQQMISNLLVNAIKFTPAPGRVEIALGNTRDDESYEIRISDTGIGIAPEFLPSIFERFSQVDSSSTRKQGGLGIGLALVKSLTEMHGGSVRVHSSGEGQGASFYVTLPKITQISPDSQATPLVEDQTVVPIDLTGSFIMVVDNEGDSLHLLKLLLEKHGATVYATESARDALIRSENQVYPIVISDISMPDMDGYTFIRKLREQQSGSIERIHAVALTAFAREEDKTRARESGFDSVLTKPIPPRDLVEFIYGIRQSMLPK